MGSFRACTPIDRVVGFNIKVRRLELRLSQGVLAAALDCTLHDFAAIESGDQRPSAAVLLLCADILECRLSDFFLGAGSAPGTFPGPQLLRKTQDL
jgi:transcriptional regulator with XRE-family HTH domain